MGVSFPENDSEIIIQVFIVNVLYLFTYCYFFKIIRMRANFLQPSSRYSKLVDDDSRHSLPISQMGNYQDHLKKMPMPLREIESAPVRQHMFGNPFKINKNMIMDEVVMDEVSLVPNGNHGGSGSSSPKGVKRPAASPSPDSPSLMMGSKRMRKGVYLCKF